MYDSCEIKTNVKVKLKQQPKTETEHLVEEQEETESATVEFGGLVLSQDWYERFISKPYDALMELAPAAWTPSFTEAIVARPSFYNEGFSQKAGHWFHVKNTIDLIPDDCLTDNAILTLLGAVDEHCGSFASAKNTRVANRVTTQMAMRIFEKSLERDHYSPKGAQRFPRNLVTDDFIKAALPLYSYQLLGILPKQKQIETTYLMALSYNPACYGRLPTPMRTDKMGEDALKKAIKRDDISFQQYRAMLRAIPDMNNIDTKVLRDVATRCPGVVKLIASRTDKLSDANLLSSALASDNMDEIRKAINATPTETLTYYLRLGFALKDTEDAKC